MTIKAPYSLWIKQVGVWKELFSAHNPVILEDMATGNVSYSGPSVERVEIRDLTGVVTSLYLSDSELARELENV